MFERVHSRCAAPAMVAFAVSVSLVVTGCKTSPLGADGSGDAGGAQPYVASCLEGALIGAGIAVFTDLVTGKKGSSTSDKIKKGALAGCAIGLAVTVVGKLYAPAQRAQAERTAQEEAQKKAAQLQRYSDAKAAAEQPGLGRTAKTQRQTELERARKEYEQPTAVSLGNGSTIEIRPEMPAQVPNLKEEGACYERIVIGTSPTGSARQRERVCNNGAGQFVTADVRQITS